MKGRVLSAELTVSWFRFALSRFWEENKLHAGQRQPVRFVQDEELAYVLTRYRQVSGPSFQVSVHRMGCLETSKSEESSTFAQLHDVMHAAFGMGISVESEVALKLIEFIQTNLPVKGGCPSPRRDYLLRKIVRCPSSLLFSFRR